MWRVANGLDNAEFKPYTFKYLGRRQYRKFNITGNAGFLILPSTHINYIDKKKNFS